MLNHWFTLNAVIRSPQHNWGGYPYPTTLKTKGTGLSMIMVAGLCTVIPTEFWGSINSVQNGILLTSSIHFLSDNCAVSINPDVCIASIFLSFLAFRSSALDLMVRALLVPISMRNLSRILSD